MREKRKRGEKSILKMRKGQIVSVYLYDKFKWPFWSLN